MSTKTGEDRVTHKLWVKKESPVFQPSLNLPEQASAWIESQFCRVHPGTTLDGHVCALCALAHAAHRATEETATYQASEEYAERFKDNLTEEERLDLQANEDLYLDGYLSGSAAGYY